jgi:transcription antitermination factor NusG
VTAEGGAIEAGDRVQIIDGCYAGRTAEVLRVDGSSLLLAIVDVGKEVPIARWNVQKLPGRSEAMSQGGKS